MAVRIWVLAVVPLLVFLPLLWYVGYQMSTANFWVRTYAGHVRESGSLGDNCVLLAPCDPGFLCVSSEGVMFTIDSVGGVVSSHRLRGLSVKSACFSNGSTLLLGYSGSTPFLALIEDYSRPGWAFRLKGFSPKVYATRVTAVHVACGNGGVYLLLRVSVRRNWTLMGRAIVVRVSSEGRVEWGRVMELEDKDIFPFSAAMLDDGGCVVTGCFPGDGGDDAFIVKFSSEGMVEWAYRLGSGGLDRGLDLAASSGGFYLVAVYDGRPCIFKFGLDGVPEWARALELENSGQDEASSWLCMAREVDVVVAATSDGGCIAAMPEEGFETPVVKVLANGTLEWCNLVAVPNHRIRSIVEAGDGYLLGGGTGGFIEEILVYKLDRRGLIPGCSWVKSGRAAFRTVRVNMSPLTPRVSEVDFQTSGFNVTFEECRVKDRVPVSSSSVIGLAVDLAAIYYYFLLLDRALRITLRVRVSPSLLLRVLRPDLERLLISAYLIYSCYNYTVMTLLRGVSPALAGILKPISPGVLEFIFMVPLLLAAKLILLPAYIAGFSLDPGSPAIIVPLIYLVACLFAYTRRRTGRPSRNDLSSLLKVYITGVSVGLTIGLWLASAAGVLNITLSGAAGLIGTIIILLPAIIIYYYAFSNTIALLLRRMGHRHLAEIYL